MHNYALIGVWRRIFQSVISPVVPEVNSDPSFNDQYENSHSSEINSAIAHLKSFVYGTRYHLRSERERDFAMKSASQLQALKANWDTTLGQLSLSEDPKVAQPLCFQLSSMILSAEAQGLKFSDGDVLKFQKACPEQKVELNKAKYTL